MNQRILGRGAAFILLVAVIIACGPDETPEQRLQRLRMNHEIVPLTAASSGEGEEAKLIVDMQVTNTGVDHLSKFTVLVRVIAEDGSERVAKRVCVDLSSIKPGIGTQVPVVIPGIELAETDEVRLEQENDLTPEELRTLPEFQDMVKE